MSSVRDRDQIVFDALALQFLRHACRLLIGDVGVLGPVNQERWRILSRDIADGAIGVERFGLLVGIQAGHFFRPNPLLPAVEVKPATVVPAGTLRQYGSS